MLKWSWTDKTGIGIFKALLMNTCLKKKNG